MNQAQFIQEMQEAGFPDPIEVQQLPNGGLGNHTHPFAVRALVIEGYIDIEIAGNSHRYAQGDIFQLSCNELHAERYGPQGVKYLASRKS
jgi:quercetin dioxygenase-like cupin family protein